MAKKMHDILPPKKMKKVEDNPSKVLARAPRKKVVRKTPAPAAVKPEAVVAQPMKNPIQEPVAQTPEPELEASFAQNVVDKKSFEPKKPHSVKRQIFIGSAVIVLLVGVYLFFKLPKADVEIWPKQNPLVLQEKITANTFSKTVNVSQKTIPVQLVEVTQNASQQFPATGLSSGNAKATGTMTVYNKLSPSAPFTLINGTHFLSDSGKYFVTMQKIVVPAMKGNTPGSVTVQIQAQETGPDYNIGASKFSIPKLNGTAYYYGLYGQSTTATSGGHTGNVKKVSSDDLETAQDTLSKTLLSDANNALKAKLTKDDVLLDDAIITSPVTATADVKADAAADNFNETVSVKISALVFKKQDAEQVVTSDMKAQLPADNNYLPDSLRLNYSPSVLDAKNGKLILTLQASANIYQNIDTNNLVTVFQNKSASQIKQAVGQLYPDGISELKINFWPFWVSSAPADKSRIKVNLNF